MNITVLYNLPTQRALKSPYKETEEDTAASAIEVRDALIKKGAQVTLISVDELQLESIREIKGDLIFNLIEWTGNDLPLSDRAFALIEQTGIPMTGATRKNFMETSNKITMKKALDSHKIPTARWQVFENKEDKISVGFRYPVIVKPALEHCSIGLSTDAIAENSSQLMEKITHTIATYHESVLVEEFISGREFQLTVIEDAGHLRVLPAAEIVYDHPNDRNLLSYNSRWEEDSIEYKTSHVRVLQEVNLQKSLETLSIKVFKELSFRDYARMDIRLRGDEILFLEVNSNPGLGDDDEYGMTLSYRAIGWDFSDFIWKIVSSSLQRSKTSSSKL